MDDHQIRPTFGDNVRIRHSLETAAAGLAGKYGVVSGVTTPSVTGVSVVGPISEDYAVAVMFEEESLSFAWFAEGLVEFLDHGAGTEIRVGDVKAVRTADGRWIETRLDGTPLASPESGSTPTHKAWWKFW